MQSEQFNPFHSNYNSGCSLPCYDNIWMYNTGCRNGTG